METNLKMLHATRYVGATVLTIGIAIFLYGVFVSEYSTIMGIGIGTVMGAVFTFLIGMFLVASEEMIINSRKCKKRAPKKTLSSNRLFTYPKPILIAYQK